MGLEYIKSGETTVWDARPRVLNRFGGISVTGKRSLTVAALKSLLTFDTPNRAATVRERLPGLNVQNPQNG